jgi:hypothetical protein
LTHWPSRFYATPVLRDAQNLSGWRSCDEHGEPTQVLSDGGKNKFILGASRAAQSKSAEPENTLQVREPHLDFLALTPRLLESVSAGEGTSNIARGFVLMARNPAKRELRTA